MSLRRDGVMRRPSITEAGSTPREARPCSRPSMVSANYGEAIDYRGNSVIAAWSYLPSFRWGMVVKQDDEEAFALIYRQLFVVSVLLGCDVPHCDGRCSLAGTHDHTADP